MKFPNQVQSIRESANLSREQLAIAAGVTRQTIGLVEAGRVSPSTALALKLAKVLSSTVEELFAAYDEVTVRVHGTEKSVERASGLRVLLATVQGNTVARSIHHPSVSFTPADGRIAEPSETEGLARIQLFHTVHSNDSPIVVSGCDLGLGLLAHHCITEGTSKHRTVWFPTTNAAALQEFADGDAHVAAVHLEANQAQFLQKHRFPFPFHVFHFSRGELGWVVRRGNPDGFLDANDLGTGRFRLVNRPLGSGVRDVLDSKLHEVNIQSSAIPGYTHIVPGHTDVVAAIAHGGADVGIAHASAAASHGMGFIPIREEVSVLLVAAEGPDVTLTDPLVQRLHSDRFRSDLSAFGAYDTTHTGGLITKEISL